MLTPLASGEQAVVCGPRSGRASTGSSAVGPPLPQYSSHDSIFMDGTRGTDSLLPEQWQSGLEDVECLPPVRFLDPTECLWNAFQRLGNLQIVNCISVVSSHRIELDTLKEAAIIVARRNQALRLVIRLSDAQETTRHRALQLQQKQQQQQQHQKQASDDGLLGEDSEASSTNSCPFSRSFCAATNRSSSSNSCRRVTSSESCAAWEWGARRSASQFSPRESSREIGGQDARSSTRNSYSSNRGGSRNGQHKEKAPLGFSMPCSCRRRAHLKFTFHERLGEPVVDVQYATVNDSLSSSGFSWPQQHGQGGMHPDLSLLEECDWMKAMAWEQKHPLNCEEGENTQQSTVHSV